MPVPSISMTNQLEASVLAKAEEVAPVAVAAPVAASAPVGVPSPSVGGYGYDWGNCTWYVAVRRQELGHPIPQGLGNANTWAARAAALGLPTGSVPRVGAVAQVPANNPYGHVVVIEAVNPDGGVTYSAMNELGLGIRNERTVPAARVASYQFIYW